MLLGGLAGGCDLAVLWPQVINIRRGKFITAAVSLLTFPWILYNSTTSFTAVLNGYAVLLAPFSGILVADYFVIRRFKSESLCFLTF
jgi:NCS1 family nucleobase:cation symporter-1